MKDSELKKKLPVQPPLEDEHGSCSKTLNDPSRGTLIPTFLLQGSFICQWRYLVALLLS
jgi:hypothetical protein